MQTEQEKQRSVLNPQSEICNPQSPAPHLRGKISGGVELFGSTVLAGKETNLKPQSEPGNTPSV